MWSVPLALLLSLSPSPLLAHDGHGAVALGVTVEELVNASQQWDGSPCRYPRGQPQVKGCALVSRSVGKGMAHPPRHQRSGDRARHLGAQPQRRHHPRFHQERPLLGDDTVHTGQAIGAEDVEVVVFYAVEGMPLPCFKSLAKLRASAGPWLWCSFSEPKPQVNRQQVRHWLERAMAAWADVPITQDADVRSVEFAVSGRAFC